MFEKLPEEEEFEREKEIVGHVKDFLAWTAILQKLTRLKKPFYLIGFNAKTKTTICRKVETKEQAYVLIKKYKLQNYVFAEEVFKKYNMGE